MSTYDADLPRVFPYQLDLPDDMADQVVELLMGRTPEFQHGSSFAITADLYQADMRRIWLSNASYERLRGSDLPIEGEGE